MTAAGKSVVYSLSVIIPVSILECTAVTNLFIHNDLAGALLLHIFVTVVMAGIAYLIYRREGNILCILLLPFVVLMGPLGAAIGILTVFIYAFCARFAKHPDQWLALFFEYQRDGDIEVLCERLRFGLDDLELVSNVEPFQDILEGGSIIQKQTALARITRYFRPRLAPFLQQALGDSNVAVRIQAATALARIERDFMKKCMGLERELNVVHNKQAQALKLARLYDEYAHAGLMDEERACMLQTKAIDIYVDNLHRHHNVDQQIDLARLLLRNGQIEKASSLLRGIVETGKTVPARALLWYMETLFQLRQFTELRLFAHKHAATLLASAPAKEAGGQEEDIATIWAGFNWNDSVLAIHHDS